MSQLVAIGAEGVRLDDLRAGFDISLMHVENGFGVGGVQFIDATLRADGFVEQRTHRAVGYQDLLSQPFVEVFDAHLAVISLRLPSFWYWRHLTRCHQRLKSLQFYHVELWLSLEADQPNSDFVGFGRRQLWYLSLESLQRIVGEIQLAEH